MDRRNRLLYLISRSVTRLKYYSIKCFSNEGITITPSQMGILFHLIKNSGMSMSQLSEKQGIDNSTLTRMVDKLARAGFVERVTNPADRRGLLVKITEEGKREGLRAAAISKDINSKIIDGFSDHEIEVFIRILESFFTKFSIEKGDL